jgi:hypothetical protein
MNRAYLYSKHTNKIDRRPVYYKLSASAASALASTAAITVARILTAPDAIDGGGEDGTAARMGVTAGLGDGGGGSGGDGGGGLKPPGGAGGSGGDGGGGLGEGGDGGDGGGDTVDAGELEMTLPLPPLATPSCVSEHVE